MNARRLAMPASSEAGCRHFGRKCNGDLSHGHTAPREASFQIPTATIAALVGPLLARSGRGTGDLIWPIGPLPLDAACVSLEEAGSR